MAEENTLHKVLRQSCEIACNPSSLQQMLVQGGRSHEKYESKMIQHKGYCMMGCAFAAAADRRIAKSHAAEVSSYADRLSKNAGAIHPTNEERERKEVVLHWFQLMRLDCSKRCQKDCAAQSKGDDRVAFKCERSCLVGCDKFFDQIFED